MFSLLECSWFVDWYLILSTIFISCHWVTLYIYAVFFYPQQHRKQCPRYSTTLQMVPSCYGTFHNTYSLNMWWARLLQLPLLFYNLQTIIDIVYFHDDFLKLINKIRPPDRPPDLIIGVLHLGYKKCFNYSIFPSLHGYIVSTALLERSLASLWSCLQLMWSSYGCPLCFLYLKSLGLTILSVIYNGLFYTSVLSLCPFSSIPPKTHSYPTNHFCGE